MRAATIGFGFGLALLAACGGTGPTTPTPSNGGGGGQAPSPNSPPVIDGIAVQGSRAKEPANFADINETVQVTATVHDAETASDKLQYQWSASSGAISGSGATVTWTAPTDASGGNTATISLTIVDSYGTGATAGQNKVDGSATVKLHDSVKEVGDMSRQFLLDFSDTNLTDADYIMRNFSRTRCPKPSEIDHERDDVVRNYTKFIMQSFRIGGPSVSVNFGASCPTNHEPKPGDACARIPSFWDSIYRVDSQRRAVDGTDIVAAVFSPDDNRWWLCSSDFDGEQVSGPAFPAGVHWYIRR
jgi:hypothetical protein